MEEYFNIRYEFDRDLIDKAIDRRLQEAGADYICVADGVVMTHVGRNADYAEVINGGMFSICDSSYVPLYLRLIYGIRRPQYTGHRIFLHLVGRKKYRMMFMGSSRRVLDPLKARLTETDPRIAKMQFIELPYRDVDGFDYAEIGKMVNADRPDIIWVALGAPKQEIFMSRLKPYLDHGVIISVGAVFKFASGVEAKRAPQWMVDHHMEFIYRILSEPKKQVRRCLGIVRDVPGAIAAEYRRKKRKKRNGSPMPQ